MTRDFSMYTYISKDGMGCICRNNGEMTPVFPTQEEFVEAYKKCEDFISTVKESLHEQAVAIVNKYNDKSIDDVDSGTDLFNLLLEYQMFSVVTNNNVKIFNEMKNAIIPNNSSDTSNSLLIEPLWDVIDKDSKDAYWYINEEFILGDEIVKQFLSDDDIVKYIELNTKIKESNNEDDINSRQKLLMKAGIGLAKTL